MWALRHAAEAAEAPFWTAWSGARAVAGLCAIGGLAAAAEVLPPEPASVLGVASVHGGLLAVALVWSRVPLAEAVCGIVLLALARALVVLHPLGALAYVAVPLWIGLLAIRGRLGGLALRSPWPWGAVAVGALGGAALALHLFVCASRTLGYTVRFEPAVFAAAMAYDLGANVISAELFFRGALLHHCWRRWPFPLALTAASLRDRGALLRRSVRRHHRAARGRGGVHDDAGPAERHPLPVVREPPPRARGRRHLLRMLPAAHERVSRASALPIVVAALLALVTAGIALDDADPASPLRHLFAVPLVLGALAFGLPGALLTGAGVVLLFAPVVLPDVERHGLTAEVAEALVTMGLLLGLGAIVGSLRTRARRQVAAARPARRDAPAASPVTTRSRSSCGGCGRFSSRVCRSTTWRCSSRTARARPPRASPRSRALWP